MAMITTVLGDIQPARLGYCQIHEHVWVKDTPAALSNPQLRMDQYDASLDELTRYFIKGGQALVDAQPVGAGRQITRLAELARAARVNVIAATGFHRPMFYRDGHWFFGAKQQQLTDLFISEIEQGCFEDGDLEWPVRRTACRAGLVKAAIGEVQLDHAAISNLRASAQAAVATGSALMLHTEQGLYALEAIRILADAGMPADKVIVCHADQIGRASCRGRV